MEEVVLGKNFHFVLLHNSIILFWTVTGVCRTSLVRLWIIQEKQRVREAFLQRNDSSSLCFFVSLQYEKNTENKESEVTLPLSKHQVLLNEQEHYLEIIEQMRWKLYELQRRLWSPKSEKLEICPMQVFVRQIIHPKYKTPDGRILIAPLLPQTIHMQKRMPAYWPTWPCVNMPTTNPCTGR